MSLGALGSTRHATRITAGYASRGVGRGEHLCPVEALLEGVLQLLPAPRAILRRYRAAPIAMGAMPPDRGLRPTSARRLCGGSPPPRALRQALGGRPLGMMMGRAGRAGSRLRFLTMATCRRCAAPETTSVCASVPHHAARGQSRAHVPWERGWGWGWGWGWGPCGVR